MARRSICSATMTFGLVAIPVKFYVAAQAESVYFCMLSPKGNRVKQQYLDKVTGDEVFHSSALKGYELPDGNILKLDKADINALEEKQSGMIDIKEFVPASTVDLLHVEKSYHLSPGKGGDRAYTLLSRALERTQQYAVARWAARGKDHLVIVRPYKDGLVIHQMFYSNEIREFDSDVAKVNVSAAEVDMACNLIATLKSETYDVSKYNDTYQDRVKTFIQAKIAGQCPADKVDEPQTTQVIDLFEALKASLERMKAS